MRIHSDLAKIIKKEQERISKEIGVEITLVSASQIIANKIKELEKR